MALARALAKRPDILLLDEPFSNLDARIRIVAREFVKRLQRKLGITAALVTHDQADAFAVADRITVMSGGEIQQIGSPLEIYGAPSNLFVAGFVGDPPMNMLEAERIRHAALAPDKIPGGPGSTWVSGPRSRGWSPPPGQPGAAAWSSGAGSR